MPESWDEILSMDDFFYDRYDRLVRPVREGRNLTELYSFISSDERDQFPDGELILVRYDPIPRPDRGEDVFLRRFIYREQGNSIRSMTWDEDRFQTMLAETGITIPPPEPLPPEPPLPAEIQQHQQQPQPEPEAPDMEPVEEQPAPPDAALLPEPPTNQSQEPSPEEETEDDENRILLWLRPNDSQQ